MADSNVRNVESATRDGLMAYQGDVLTDSIMDKINFSGIGNVLAVTPNDEVNSLACLHFKNIISEQNIFQLAYRSENGHFDIAPSHLSGRTLFGADITYDNLSLRFSTGAGLYALDIYDVEQFKKKLDSFVPLFVITAEKHLIMWTADDPPSLQVGQTVIGLLDPADEDIVDPAETAFTPLPGILTPLIKETLTQSEPPDPIKAAVTSSSKSDS